MPKYGSGSADPIKASRIIAHLSIPGNENLSNCAVARIFCVYASYVQRAKLVFKWGQTKRMDPRKLRTDGGTQHRQPINELVLDQYSGLMKSGVIFPPITAFYDGANYWVADGHLRTKAAIIAGIKVEVDVQMGDLRDAQLASCSAQGPHGLKRTKEDRDRAVLMLLRDEEWGQWNDDEIGRQCKVNGRVVKAIRESLGPRVDTISGRLLKIETNGMCKAEDDSFDFDEVDPLLGGQSQSVVDCSVVDPIDKFVASMTDSIRTSLSQLRPTDQIQVWNRLVDELNGIYGQYREEVEV